MEIKVFTLSNFIFGTLLFLIYKGNIMKAKYSYFLLNFIYFFAIIVGIFNVSKVSIISFSDFLFVAFLSFAYVILGYFIHLKLLALKIIKNYFFFIISFIILMVLCFFVIFFIMLLIGILFDLPGL